MSRFLAFLLGALLCWPAWAQQVPKPVSAPNSAAPGNVATFDNLAGTLLKDSGVSLRPNAVASGFSLAEQALFLSGTYTGSGAAPYAEFSITDTAQNLTVGTTLVGLRVDHTFSGGAGNRSAMQPALVMSGTTSGTNDALKFYHGIFSQFYGRANDGGSGVAAKGNAYGAAAIAQLENGATFWNSVQGMEIDVSLQAGSSARYKSVLTLSNVNSDAVKGSVYDAMLSFLSDSPAKFNYLIAFGRPGAGTWPGENTTGTIIGVPAGSGAFALKGVDFTNVTFATGGFAFQSPGFGIDPSGNLFAGNLQASGVSPQIGFYDTASSSLSSRVRFISLGDAGAGAYQYQINTASAGDYSSVNLAYTIAATGRVGFNQPTPATQVDVNGTFRVTQASPAAAAACAAGQIVADANFLYTCSASGAWKRVAVTGGY